MRRDFNLFMDPKKRQMIIVAAAVLFSLYGLFNLAGSKARQHPGVMAGGVTAGPDAAAREGELRAFIAQTSAQLASGRPGTYDSYVVRLAESNWGRDPFSGKNWTESESAEKDSPAPRPNFAYNGYVQRGNHRVAIINGREYMAGDQLEEKGFFVKKISSAKVMIKNRRDGSEFEVPLSQLETGI